MINPTSGPSRNCTLGSEHCTYYIQSHGASRRETQPCLRLPTGEGPQNGSEFRSTRCGSLHDTSSSFEVNLLDNTHASSSGWPYRCRSPLLSLGPRGFISLPPEEISIPVKIPESHPFDRSFPSYSGRHFIPRAAIVAEFLFLFSVACFEVGL